MTRSFLDDPVDPDVLQRVLDAGFRAPSAGNTRSLELLVLTRAEVTTYWRTTLSPERRASFPWPRLLDAPVLLIPYVDPSEYVSRYGESDKSQTGLGEGVDAWSVPYWWVDGGAAMQNLLLAVEAEGLGACFFGQFEHESAVREAFGVPDRFRAVGTVAMGHRDRVHDRPSRSAARPSRSTRERTHRGRW